MLASIEVLLVLPLKVPVGLHDDSLQWFLVVLVPKQQTCQIWLNVVHIYYLGGKW